MGADAVYKFGQRVQTFLELEYCNYAKLLELHICLFEKHRQVIQHVNVVRSQQLQHLHCVG